MKKEKLWLASVVAVLMTAILLTGFIGRLSYETQSQYAFVSANMANLTANGRNNEDSLTKLRDAGARVVTVKPLTIKGLKDAERLELISYSSLSINEDVISQEIRTVLGTYPMKKDNLIAVCTDPVLGEFLNGELSYRYTDYQTHLLADGQTRIFAFQNLTAENDLIAGYDYGELSLIQSLGMKAAIEYPSYTFENPVYTKYFKQLLNFNGVSFVILRDNPYDNKQPLSEEMKNLLRSSDFTLVLWEQENQLENERPFLYDELLQLKKNHTIRGFNIDTVSLEDTSHYRYRYYQWHNSLLNRNISFLNVNLLENPGLDGETNFYLTVNAVRDFVNNHTNYQFPNQREEIRYQYPTNTVTMAGGVLALSLLYLYLLLVLKQPPKFYTEIYFGLVILSVVFSYAFSVYLAAAYAILITVFAVSLLMAVLFYLDRHQSGYKKILWMVLAFFGISICSLIGISALLGGIEFYTSTRFIRGVWISLVLPLLTTVWSVYAIYYQDSVPIKELPKTFWNWLKSLKLWVSVPVAVVGALALTYYIIRSGNSEWLLPFEDTVRKWLTDVFYVRPRFKEFLIGYPAFSLFVYLSVTTDKKQWNILFGLLTTVLFTSIFNTFCHAFTPVVVSLWRVANGLICGLLVSLVVIGIILLVRHVILPNCKKKS
ncbi:MAG: hypothetical protein J6A61_00870 [Clostridia bacterium]|nr:hypothetical protein [Clostridia bacterium]